MNTRDDDNDALTPEERALAQRLARLGAQAEPSPALDARILAAAHAASAASEEHVPPMRRHSYRRARHRSARWPVLFAFVGSLALAFGIAWELRPLPTPASQQAEVADDALASYKAPPPPAMKARVLPPKPLNIPAPPPAAEPPAPPRRAAIRAATPDDAEEKPRAFDDSHFMDEAVPIALPEAGVAAAPPPAEDAAAATMAQQAAPAAVAPATPAAAKAANSLQREADAAARAAHEARLRQEPAFAEPDEEAPPPATADSPEVRDAWLDRIRELLRDGDTGAARESLRAFRLRYPAHVLPEDLRALEE